MAEEATRATVVPGQAREETIRRLGAPAYNFGAGRAFAYPWTTATGSVLVLAPGGAMLGPVAWAKAQVFIVVFDDQGGVLKSGTSEVPLYRSVSAVVRNWMLGEGLEQHVRPQARTEQAAIVVYRGSSPPCNPRQHAVDPWSPFVPTVTVDGQTIGDVLKGQFLLLAVAPGTHAVVMEAVPGFRRFEYENVLSMSSPDLPASLTVEVGPGQTVYAEGWLCLEMDADNVKARHRMHLEPRDPEQARPALTELKSAWP